MFLQTLWFMIKTAAIIAIAVWLVTIPGFIELSFLDYDVRVQTGVALAGGFIALLIVLFLHKVLLGIFSFPRLWRRYQERKCHIKGLNAVTVGLAAVAAGDSKIASYQAFRARKLLPDDKGLSVLLEAQAARMKGQNDQARDSFQRLMDNRDTAFLGLRGLLLTSMEEGDLTRALTLAQDAVKLHPKQPWILLLYYRLCLKARRWDDALSVLQRVRHIRAIDEAKAKSDQIALLLQQSEEADHRGEKATSLRLARKAQALDPLFVPAALRLATLYNDEGQRRSAVKTIEMCWCVNPHPALVPLWESLAPVNKKNDPTAHLRWFERLLALKPDSVESQIAAARAAMEDGMWGEARQYLAMGEKLQPTARLYRLWARYAERQHQPEEARLWLERATEAKGDKVWLCTETGRIYERWSAVAEPHGSFNTIVWGYPDSLARMERSLLPAQDMLIESAAAVSARQS